MYLDRQGWFKSKILTLLWFEEDQAETTGDLFNRSAVAQGEGLKPPKGAWLSRQTVEEMLCKRDE